MEIRAGFGIETITPSDPLPLAGLGEDRKGLSVLDDLHVRAIYVSDGKAELVLVSLDALYVSRAFCTQLANWLVKDQSIPQQHLFVAATHTHCAPSLLDRGFAGISTEPEYTEYVLGKSKAAISTAIQHKFEVEVEFSSAPSQVSINRRARRLDRAGLRRLKFHRPMANRPNKSGPVDNTVRAVWLRARSSADADIALISAGCHPSILRGQYFSADFPGRIQTALNALTDRPLRAVFVHGFSGNSRARLLENAPFAVWPVGKVFDWAFDRSRFRNDPTEKDLIWVAERIAAGIANAPRTRCDDVRLGAEVSEIRLPLDGHGGGEDDVPFLIHTWALSDRVRLLGLEGEIFSEYGTWLGANDATAGAMTMPASCVGGIVGYVPTADPLIEGGYEIDRSRALFDLPRRFSPEVEAVLKTGIRNHLGQNN